MTKWAVRIWRKRRSGATSPAAPAGRTLARRRPTATSAPATARRARAEAAVSVRRHGNAGDILEEVEVRERREADTGEPSLRHGNVGLVPEAHVGTVLRDDQLHLPVKLEALRSVFHVACLVQHGVHLGVA